MSLVSASDFQNWKSDSVTQAYFEAINIRIDEAKDTLSDSAGLDSLNDNFIRGFIAAYRELLEFRIDDLTEGQ
jgi:hypothetical protein